MRAESPDWARTTLAKSVTWMSGGTPSKSVSAFWGGNIPWVSPKDMKVFRLSTAQDKVTELGAAAGSRMAPEGAILVVVRGMILAHTFPVCLTTRALAFNQDVKALLPTSEVDGSYLAHWFVGNEDKLLGLVTEATHGTKRIDLKDLQQVSLDLPPLPEQRRIAEVLDTLDEAIRKTEQVIAKLQQVKQGLLNDLLTRGIDEHGQLRSPPYRSPALYERGIAGVVPKTWKVRRVRDVGSIQLGRQRSPQHERGRHMMPYLRVANVYDGFIDYGDILSMNFNPQEQDQFGLHGGDILLNEGQSLELVGRSALYEGPAGAYCFQNTLIRFRANADTCPRFAQAVFKRALDNGSFKQVAKQTTSIAHLGASRLARMPFPLPPLLEQRQIAGVLERHESRTTAEQSELAKLRTLKQGLMDDLLSGRVRTVPSEPAP